MSAPQTTPPPTRHKRRRKLIRPRLQLKLTAIATLVALIALMLQYTLFARTTASLAARLPNDAVVLLELAQEELLGSLALSVLVLLPLSVAAGILSTFRVAGPVYRIETYLKQVIAGERPSDCRLRDGDELQELCSLVNDATRPLREDLADAPAEPEREAA